MRITSIVYIFLCLFWFYINVSNAQSFFSLSNKPAAEQPIQRYIIIHNDAPIPIYPVVQVPEDGNCRGKSTDVSRIIFKPGIKTGETVRINIPGKEHGHDKSCWYNAGRVYLFSVDITTFEERLKFANQKTRPHNYSPVPTCELLDKNKQPLSSGGGCFTGKAGASYPLDSPAQLAEYTFDADDEKGNPSPDPDVGKIMTDIDLSYVDQVYLPISISIDNGGTTGYMGTSLSLHEFNQRVNNFIREANWAGFAAYTQQNWPNNLFHDLVPPSEHVPAGYNLITLVNTQAVSVLYTKPKSTLEALSRMANEPVGPCAALDPNNPQCEAHDQRPCCHPPCTAGDPRCCCNRGCVVVGLTAGNLCCPTDDKTMLACCAGTNPPPTPPPTPPPALLEPFMVDRTVIASNKEAQNPAVANIVDKWKVWLVPKSPCYLPKFLVNPAKGLAGKKQFCERFHQTVLYVWNEFARLKAENPAKFSCAVSADKPVDETNCMLQHIIGYTADILGGRLPESVQALLRGVPWTDPHGKEPLYQYDKWLLFWAPYQSVYNLNPFTHFVHNDIKGIDAVAYSFSIDDKYGNFRDLGKGFIINVGGISALDNKTMFDPYQQYFINWPDRWDHAIVCGREVNIKGHFGNSRITMWQDGQQKPFCEIIMYPTEANQPNVKFKLTEETRNVIDTYTGKSHQVATLVLDPAYCKANSEGDQTIKNICDQVHLVALMGVSETSYVSVPDNERPKVSLNLPPGPLPSKECQPACTGKLVCVEGKCVTPPTTTADIVVDPTKINPSDPRSLNCDGIVPKSDHTGATCNVTNNVLTLTQWNECKDVQLRFDEQGTLIKPLQPHHDATPCGHYCVRLGYCAGGATPPPTPGQMVHFHFDRNITIFDCAPVGNVVPIDHIWGKDCPLNEENKVKITLWGQCREAYMVPFDASGNFLQDKNDPKALRIIPNPAVPHTVNIMPDCR